MSLLQLLQKIPDPRVQRTRRHELIDLLASALCATIAGADNWVETVEFAQAHQAWLQRFLRLPSGVASHDTFARGRMAVDLCILAPHKTPAGIRASL